jgi:dTMP kinase
VILIEEEVVKPVTVHGIEISTAWYPSREEVTVIESSFDYRSDMTPSLPKSTLIDIATEISSQRPGTNEWYPNPLNTVVTDYVTIYKRILNLNVIDRNQSNYNVIDFGIATNFFTGEAYSTEWALLHSCAQRLAIEEIHLEMGLPNSTLEAFAANLFIQEMEHYAQLSKDPEARSLLSYTDELQREKGLLYWHSTWIDQSFFTDRADSLKGRYITLTKAAVFEHYRNPFGGVPWIGFEGLDGSGKDTQADLLKKFLEDVLSSNILSQGFPTNYPIGAMTRAVLKGNTEMDPIALQKLFEADRAQFIQMYSLEPKREDAIFMTTRYSASGIAYAAESWDELLYGIMGNMFQGWSDIMLYVDLPVEECLRRVDSRGGERELFEKREALEKAKSNFRKLCRILPNMILVDGTKDDMTYKSKEEIFREIVELLITRLPEDVLNNDTKRYLGNSIDTWIDENRNLFK